MYETLTKDMGSWEKKFRERCQFCILPAQRNNLRMTYVLEKKEKKEIISEFKQ